MKNANPDIDIPLTIEEEIKLYAQSDILFSKNKDENKNIKLKKQ
jgi:hypothetical protein